MTIHTNYSDLAARFFIGGLSKCPTQQTTIAEKVVDRADNCVKRVLQLVADVGNLDKTLKLAEAGLKVTKHLDPEAYAPAAKAHVVIKDTRGVIGIVKIPGGLKRIFTNITNVATILARKVALTAHEKLVLLHEALSAVSNSLYTAAFTSKAFSFINSKYQSLKGAALEFSKVFPKIFFGLHLVAVPKVITAIMVENEKYASSPVLNTSNKVSDAWTNSHNEINHIKKQTCNGIDLVKTGFEFVGDVVMFAKLTNPVVGLVSTVGVAVLDFTAVWIKTM